MNVMSKALSIKDRAIEKATDFGARCLLQADRMLAYSGECVHTAFKPKWEKMLTILPVVFSMLAVTAFAAEGDGGSASAESAIETILSLLQTWIPRLGALVVVVGAIQLGLGFKDEDSSGKTRSMQTMIGGAIVGGLVAIINF
jgi:hypothetical protein